MMNRNILIYLLLILLCFFLFCKTGFAEDISLENALKIAMENNPVIKSMNADYLSLKSERQVIQSENSLSASVNGFLGYRDMQAITASAPDSMPASYVLLPSNDWGSANFSLMYPLYTGGKIKALINSAAFKESAGRWNLQKTENDVAFLVKYKYFQTLFKNQEVKVYLRLIELEKEQLKISENLYKAGKISLFYHLRAKNELARAQQELNDKIAELEIALSELKKIIGFQQSSEIFPSDTLAPITFDKTLDECIKTAINERPDLKSIMEELKSQEEEIKKVKSSYLPQVYLMGMYDYKNNMDRGYSVSVAGSLPVIDSGTRKFKMEEAKRKLEKILSLKKDLELTVEQEVVRAFEQYKAAKGNILLADEAISEAEEVYRIAKLKYEERKGIYVEILDALLNLTEANIRKYDSIYKNNAALAELYLTMGLK